MATKPPTRLNSKWLRQSGMDHWKIPNLWFSFKKLASAQSMLPTKCCYPFTMRSHNDWNQPSHIIMTIDVLSYSLFNMFNDLLGSNLDLSSNGTYSQTCLWSVEWKLKIDYLFYVSFSMMFPYVFPLWKLYIYSSLKHINTSIYAGENSLPVSVKHRIQGTEWWTHRRVATRRATVAFVDGT